MVNEQANVFTIRALIFGLILSAAIAAGDVYNLIVLQGSYMTLDFTTPAAIFFLFWVVLINFLVRKFRPQVSLSSAELIQICVMLMVASSIPTMGLTLYLVPLLAGTKYFSSAANRWDTLLLPHINQKLILQDNQAIAWFYEGLPKGERIPWGAWWDPLKYWIPLILVVFLAMILIMVLLRKQWVEKEKLNYPMTKAPLALAEFGPGHIFGSRVFWLAFALPFVIGCVNGLHYYFPLFPQVTMRWSLPLFRRTLAMDFRISLPMIGFTYFVNLPLAFSLWFFCLFHTVEQGIFNVTGFERKEFLPYNADRPILGWQALGALIVIVLYGLWNSRQHLRTVACAWRKTSDQEIICQPVCFWGAIACLLVISAWTAWSGLSFGVALVTVGLAFIIFIGITRVVAEGGLAATRAPVIAPVITTALIGSSHLSASGLTALGLMFVYTSDVRTFVMAAAANGLKMIEGFRQRPRLIFWSMMVAAAVSLLVSTWATILLSYRHGAINANHWFFIAGPQYPWKYFAEHIRNPEGPNWFYLGFTAIGAAIAIILQFLRTRFLWFPFHPLGFAFSTIMMTNALWFSIFIAWLVKVLILKYGGARVYEQAKPFFIGLIVGQFVVNGLWLLIDFLTRHTGNSLFWA
ncbi:MAG: hypothetical protein NC911_07910 [Candidatus Omnitrophica bacterium]|nr:hypothetical protein [Candidatus Omnitrophota bacterium]